MSPTGHTLPSAPRVLPGDGAPPLTRLGLGLAVALAAACGGARSDVTPARKDAGPLVSTPAEADPVVAAGGAAYAKYCALCHGATATGYAADNAPSLVSRTFLESADDAFLARSIELGRPGTAMAGYGRDLGGPLGERDIAAIVAFLRDKGGVAATVPLPPPLPGDPERGKAHYATMCQSCHGDASARGPNVHLAHPTFLALASDAFLRHAIVYGRPGTTMEAFASRLDGGQVADVVAYIRSFAQPVATSPALPDRPVTPPTGPDGPVVLNPKGKQPTFTAREGRFVPSVQVAQALARKQRLVIIDARPPSDWIRERIPGSISVPHYDTSSLDRVPRDAVVIAYCACPHHASGVVVDELRRRGHAKAYVLDEGVLFWKKQGYPVEGTGGPDPHAGHDHHHHHHH